jgi:hypothetical protein
LKFDPAKAIQAPMQGRVLASNLIVSDTQAFSGKKVNVMFGGADEFFIFDLPGVS